MPSASQCSYHPWLDMPKRSSIQEEAHAKRGKVSLSMGHGTCMRRVRKVAQLELSEFEARAAHRDGHPLYISPTICSTSAPARRSPPAVRNRVFFVL